MRSSLQNLPLLILQLADPTAKLAMAERETRVLNACARSLRGGASVAVWAAGGCRGRGQVQRTKTMGSDMNRVAARHLVRERSNQV